MRFTGSAVSVRHVSAALPALVLMLLLYAVSSASAATITVTSANDSGPGSLRDAVTGAAPGDTINFSLPSPSIITLTGGAITLNKDLTITGPDVFRIIRESYPKPPLG
jgi:hypothetical protein